ncbi:uncharacterized protein VTP21DRAFT_4355 [Calcarisporiella thermophila]|uniref:uncharacterized protein n=1 Tax=Calcarisporiella thermophila TaxID=911321 RepID=UPI00374422C3
MVVSAEHCIFCFDVLAAHFEGRKHLPPAFTNDSYPLFVTWNISKNGQTRLRGCIGNFDALPLHEGLKQYALTSALNDKRFSPITLQEISHLTCGVSLLTDFEKGKDYMDWEIGTHGIWIEFIDDYGRTRTATYLPEVAEEQEWTKLETIDSLLRKGGYRGRITEKVRDSITLTRYKSRKYTLNYNEYLAFTKSKSNGHSEHLTILEGTMQGEDGEVVEVKEILN